MKISTIILAHPELLSIIFSDKNEVCRSETDCALLLGTQRERIEQLNLLNLNTFDG